MNSVKLVRVLDHRWPITVVCLVENDHDLLLGNNFLLGEFRFRFLNYLRETEPNWFEIKKRPRPNDFNTPYYIRAGLLEDTLRTRAALLREIDNVE